MSQVADVKWRQSFVNNSPSTSTTQRYALAFPFHIVSFPMWQNPCKQPQQLPSGKTHLLSHNLFFIENQEKLLQGGKPISNIVH